MRRFLCSKAPMGRIYPRPTTRSLTLQPAHASPCRCRTSLPTRPPWEPHFSPLPTNSTSHPSTVLPNPKAQPFCQLRPLQVRALWGPVPFERRKKVKGRKTRKKEESRRMKLDRRGSGALSYLTALQWIWTLLSSVLPVSVSQGNTAPIWQACSRLG